MNKFVGWDLLHSENEKCGKCGMKEEATKKGCCKDEHKQLKLETDHQLSAATGFTTPNASPALITPFYSYQFQIQSFEIVSDINFHPPPNLRTQKLNILYCNYRI
jgi:hypothetical protein